MLIAALALSIIAIVTSLAFQISERRARARRFRGLVLKPNCLLTRYPIAFVSGPRTVFRLFDHWNDIPLYLREHGYEVYVIEPSGRTLDDRVSSVCAALESFSTRCHLIADGSLESDIEVLASMKLSQVSTFTVVKTSLRANARRPSAAISPRDLKPLASAISVFEVLPEAAARGWSARLKLILLAAHNALIQRRSSFVHPFETGDVSPGFATEKRFLDLAISLAERDVIGSD